jgi:hypothetical protein
VLSQPASAAEVTIDPGLFNGDYNAGTGWIRNGAVQMFTIPDGTSLSISVGGSYPNQIVIHVDASGNISSNSSRITITGNTVEFHTVPVDVDPGLYDGQYHMLGYRSGPATLHFWPAGTGSDDIGSHYRLGNGATPWSTGFELDVSGNVITDSSRIIASNNSITFVTVPVVIDPGAYTGRYNIGQYRDGPQTVYLMPEGTGTDDVGSRWTIGNGSWPWATYFDLDTSGNVLTDSTRLTVVGNSITFLTVPVILDLGMYLGRWSSSIGYIQNGAHTMHLLPKGTGTMDFGSRWHMSNAVGVTIFFELDTSGNISSDSSRIDISGNYMTLNTIPIDIDPGTHTGAYSVDSVWIYGPQRRYLLGEGSGLVMDRGAGWNLHAPGLSAERFDIDTPCAIIPSETITLGSGASAVDFLVTCADVIVDTDEDGVADTSDNCPTTPNEDQVDQDNDGLGNVCDDDLDGDDVDNDHDNCPDLANASQSDLDGDGLGDDCDEDADGDTVADSEDNCPLIANTDQANGDGDAYGDACDSDDDNDGFDDGDDNCPNTANPDQFDIDLDGEGDACDGDVDGDSVGNDLDLCPATAAGLPITDEGCSGQQWVDLICDAESFPNHGRYVSCVAHVAKDLVNQGLISNKEKSRFVTQAARD